MIIVSLKIFDVNKIDVFTCISCFLLHTKCNIENKFLHDIVIVKKQRQVPILYKENISLWYKNATSILYTNTAENLCSKFYHNNSS